MTTLKNKQTFLILPKYPEYLARNDSDIIGPIFISDNEKTHRTFYEYRYKGDLQRPSDTKFTKNGSVCKILAWFNVETNCTHYIVYDGRLPDFRVNIDYRLRNTPISLRYTLQNAIARMRKTRLDRAQQKSYARRQRKQRKSFFHQSQHRVKRNTVKIPHDEFGNETETLTTKIEATTDNHYFRHVGRIIGAASFAHISMEINFKKIRRGMEKACACAYTDLHEIFPKLTSEGTSKYGLEQRMKTIQILCNQQLSEIEEARFSFSALDTQITSSSKTIEKFRQYFHKDKPTEEIQIDNLRHVNGTDSTEKQRRSVAAGIGLILTGFAGLFGGWQISELWTNRAEMDEIMEVVDQHDLKINQAIDHLTSLNLQVNKIAATLEILADYSTFNTVADVCQTEVTAQMHATQRVLDGIYLLLHRRLHPGLVDPEALKEKLKRIDTKAATRHQHIGISSVNELYQMETSYISDGENNLIAMVHIPLYQLSTLMTLWEYIPTAARTGLNDTKSRGKVFHFRPKKKMLARTPEAYYRELSQEDLSQCHRAGDTYICDHLSVLERKEEASCLNSLFIGNEAGIEENCEIDLMSEDKPETTQIDAHRFLLYVPEITRIDVLCEAYRMDATTSKRVKGIILVTMPDGCVGKTPTSRFNSVGNLGTYHTFVSTNSRFNVSRILHHIEPEDLTRIFNRMAEDKITTISLPKIQNAFYHRREWLQRRSIGIGTGTITTILFILFVCVSVWAIFIWCFPIQRFHYGCCNRISAIFKMLCCCCNVSPKPKKQTDMNVSFHIPEEQELESFVNETPKMPSAPATPYPSSIYTPPPYKKLSSAVKQLKRSIEDIRFK